MRIGANNNSLAAQRLNNVNSAQNRASERMASGRQINRAADNAAGMAISETLLNQIRGLDQAINNSRDGISLVRTAEGAMGDIGDMLGRVRELTLQASNGILTNEQRGIIHTEVSQLLNEIDRTARNTEFNQRPVLEDGDVNLQTGPNAGQLLDMTLRGMDLDNLGLSGYSSIFESAAQGSVAPGTAVLSGLVNEVDDALSMVNAARAELGAVENRLGHTVNSLSNTSVNTAEANSRIRDADMARESLDLHRNNVLQQASLTMMAQANIQMGAGLRLLS